MSGLSQVKGNGYLSSVERSYYDVIYAEKQTLFRDAEILFKTVGVMLAGEEKFLAPVSAEKINEIRIIYGDSKQDGDKSNLN